MYLGKYTSTLSLSTWKICGKMSHLIVSPATMHSITIRISNIRSYTTCICICAFSVGDNSIKRITAWYGGKYYSHWRYAHRAWPFKPACPWCWRLYSHKAASLLGQPLEESFVISRDYLLGRKRPRYSQLQSVEFPRAYLSPSLMARSIFARITGELIWWFAWMPIHFHAFKTVSIALAPHSTLPS